MWGNRLGWTLSAGLVAFVAGIVLLIELSSGITLPTALGRKAAGQIIRLPIEPSSIVAMDQPGDAGDIYGRIIKLVLESDESYRMYDPDERFIPNDAVGQAKVEPVMKLLKDATRLAKMDLFGNRIAQTVTYDYPGHRRKELKALVGAGQMAKKLGLIKRNMGQTDGAMELFHAAFALGAKMFGERVVYEEMQEGYELMTACARAMADTLKAKGDAGEGALRTFEQESRTYYNGQVSPTWAAIHTIDMRVTADHAGDWFLLASLARERVWRVEAALEMGLLPWTGGSVPDQRGAGRALRSLAEDPNEDPAVRAAADAARKLTIAQYRQLGM